MKWLSKGWQVLHSGSACDKKIIVIVGPTAVGKTAVGISLAQRIGGEIISCDSMQVYQEAHIISNKPSLEEMSAVPHHLIGIVSVTQNFDAATFQRLAQERIERIVSRNKTPVIVGGTGLYLKILLDGIFDGGHVPEDVRMGVQEDLADGGRDRLYAELQAVDPVAAARIHCHDTQRIARAVEFYRSKGTPMSALQTQTEGIWGKYNMSLFGLMMDRACLYRRIDSRVEQMFDAGLIKEVEALQKNELSHTARAMIGLNEVGAYLSGDCSLDQAKQDMKKNTRHLAKRQMTWFRAEKRLSWIDVYPDSTADEVAGHIQRILKEEHAC